MSEASFEQILNSAAARLDGKHPGLNSRLRFNLGEEGTYDLVIHNGRASISRDTSPPADVTVRVKPEHARKLLAGRMNPVIAFATGKVKIDGDKRALAILQDLL